VESHRPLLDNPDAVTALLWKVLWGVPTRMRVGAMHELIDRLTDIHVSHGRGEPEWLARVRNKLVLLGSEDSRTDAELLGAYAEAANDGLAFNTIYFRYRDQVRSWLEAEGLTTQDAEQRIGTVFFRALEGAAVNTSPVLRGLLLRVAHEVAYDPNWDTDAVDRGVRQYP
jgi:hypothetical protein